jgi:PAS domain S-box-containing protein
LEESEELYRSMIELYPDGIVATDAKGMILIYNTAASRMLGYSKDEIVGKHFSKVGIFRVKDTPKYLRIFSSCLRGKIPEPFEMTIYRKDRTTLLAEVSVGLLKVSGKRILQVVIRDITGRKRGEE